MSPTIQNELIELLATEVEKENLQQLKLAKYFSIILDCTPDMSHHEQMSVILRYVLCNEEAAVVKETFFGYLRISDSTGKGLLDAFLEKATKLQLELSDCRGERKTFWGPSKNARHQSQSCLRALCKPYP